MSHIEYVVGPNIYQTFEEAREAQRFFNGLRMVEWMDRCIKEEADKGADGIPKTNWERYHYRQKYEEGPMPVLKRKVGDWKVAHPGVWGPDVKQYE